VTEASGEGSRARPSKAQARGKRPPVSTVPHGTDPTRRQEPRSAPILCTPARLDWLGVSCWGRIVDDSLWSLVSSVHAPHALPDFPFTWKGLSGTAHRPIGKTGAALTIAGWTVEIFGTSAHDLASRAFSLTATGKTCAQLGDQVVAGALLLARKLTEGGFLARVACNRVDACFDFIPGRWSDFEEWKANRVSSSDPAFYGSPLQTWQEGKRASGSTWRMYDKTRQATTTQQHEWLANVQARWPHQKILRCEAELHTKELDRLNCRDLYPALRQPEDYELVTTALASWLHGTINGAARLRAASPHGAALARQRPTSPTWLEMLALFTEGDGTRARTLARPPSPEWHLERAEEHIRKALAAAADHPANPGVTVETLTRQMKEHLVRELDLIHAQPGSLTTYRAELAGQLIKAKADALLRFDPFSVSGVNEPLTPIPPHGSVPCVCTEHTHNAGQEPACNQDSTSIDPSRHDLAPW